MGGPAPMTKFPVLRDPAVRDDDRLRVRAGLVLGEYPLRSHHWNEALAVYRRNQDLIGIGAYPQGSNPAIDEAIRLHEPLKGFLRQPVDQGCALRESWEGLARSLGAGTTTPPAPVQRATS